MENEGAAAFWSYAHQDNDAENQRVLKMADDLAAEYALVTGDDIQIFVDRTSLKWGDQWRTRIEDALTRTTFFLPVISPRYFKRPECRRELLTFHSQASALGMSEFLLPILYANVPHLSEDSEDKAVAIVAGTQYIDWTKLRLTDPTSSEYRNGINEMAIRLSEIALELSHRPSNVTGVAGDDQPRVLDLLRQVTELWPQLVDVVEEDRNGDHQYNALWEASLDRQHRLRRSGRTGTIPALVEKLAKDSLPLAELHLRLARRYSSLAIELDPLIVGLFRLEEEGAPEVRDMLHNLRLDIGDIHERVLYANAQAADKSVSHLEALARKSRSMQRVLDLFDQSESYVSEGNRIVQSWYDLTTTEGDDTGKLP